MAAIPYGERERERELLFERDATMPDSLVVKDPNVGQRLRPRHRDHTADLRIPMMITPTLMGSIGADPMKTPYKSMTVRCPFAPTSSMLARPPKVWKSNTNTHTVY